MWPFACSECIMCSYTVQGQTVSLHTGERVVAAAETSTSAESQVQQPQLHTAQSLALQHARIMRSLPRTTSDSDLPPASPQQAARRSSSSNAPSIPQCSGTFPGRKDTDKGTDGPTGKGSGRFPRKKLPLHGAQQQGQLMAPLPRSPHSHLPPPQPAGSHNLWPRDAVCLPQPSCPISTIRPCHNCAVV